ncbi:hypothetical protein COCON_G00015030 [Conger conger]|uniref:Tubulin--tyrosine ligase-like protein 5 n=1 Tax=Conger conger TaxID=82655 RepID=A0A9Q1E3D6_CONCO|nr:hypothetical protein COCON_G00015030 [Conger conger]
MLTNHGFHEVHPNSNDFNLMWTGSHLKPYLLRNLLDFQKVNHFPRSYELTRKDRLYKNIQRMQQMHGFKNFHIVPQTFVLPSEFQEFCSCFSKDRGPWIIKPVASSRGRGIYLVSNPNQIPLDENILVSRYLSNPLLIDDFKFDVRLYVLVTSYEPLIIYLYEEGLARFATVKYDRAAKNIKNQFMHLTNYSVNKKSRDYVSCDDPEVEDYGNKWSMSAILRYLKQEGKDTALLMGQVEDLVIKAVLSAELQIATACKMFVPHRTNCFELYGFDVLIDSNLKPWLLEVNLSPSLACDAPLDLKIKASMISDMFSLVGFVCQNPLARHPRLARATLDPGSRYQAQKCQRPVTAQPGMGSMKGGQRPMSASDADTNGLKEKLVGRKGDSTLGLTTDELKVLRRIKEEHERRGGFVRIFPTAQTWDQYSGYLEYKTSMNCMLATRLFPERNGLSGSVLLQVEARRHVIQYERKLPSLEARRRRRDGSGPSARPSGGGEEPEEIRPPLLRALPQTESQQRAAPQRPASPPPPKPKINLLQILQQGWDLSKVQARMAFSSFLHRVQMRLLAESRGNGSTAWPEKDDDQMELVIRFLKRAAGNLHEDLRMVLPSRRLPLPDRRRILSHQLGEFLHCYNKETEQMVKNMEQLKDEERCVDPDIFQEFVTEASESDLEEVLTFYTHKNKSASVFLGTACKRAKANNGPTSSGEPAETQSAVSAANEESGPSELLPLAVGPTAPQLQVPVSQYAPVHPAALDCAHIHLQHLQPSPQLKSQPKCPGPPPVPVPPHHPTHISTPPPAPESSQAPPPGPPQTSGPAPLPRATWATARHGSAPLAHAAPEPGQRGRPSARAPPTTTTATLVPSTVQIYSQKLSRPISARAASRKPSPPAAGQAQLAEKQGMLTSSHVSPHAARPNNNLRGCHQLGVLSSKPTRIQSTVRPPPKVVQCSLTNLNLANGAFVRSNFTLSPSARHGMVTHGPVRAVRTDTSPVRGPWDDGDSLCDGDGQGAYSLVTGVSPQQRYHPTSGSYQLQFAIQQLQQQKMQSRQLLDHSRARHQAILAAQGTAPPPAPAPRPPTPASTAAGPRLTHPSQQNQPHTRGGPVLAPKPPTSHREGLFRKTATQRLNKQCSPEAHASGAGSNAQHVVYETVCGKAGLSVYSKLFQSYGSKNSADTQSVAYGILLLDRSWFLLHSPRLSGGLLSPQPPPPHFPQCECHCGKIMLTDAHRQPSAEGFWVSAALHIAVTS